MENIKSLVEVRLRDSTSRWGWVVACGVAFVAIGIVAFLWPATASIGITFALAALFIASGCVGLVIAFKLKGTEGSFARFTQAILSIAAGVLMYRYPAMGLVGVAVALAFFLFAEGAVKWQIANEIRPERGWGGLFFSSMCSFFLGVITLWMLPFSAVTIPGILFGANLVVGGAAVLSLGMSLRRAHNELDHRVEDREGRRLRRVA